MVLFPTLSPEEINLITVKEQRISDKLKKKKRHNHGKIFIASTTCPVMLESQRWGGFTAAWPKQRRQGVHTTLSIAPRVFISTWLLNYWIWFYKIMFFLLFPTLSRKHLHRVHKNNSWSGPPIPKRSTSHSYTLKGKVTCCAWELSL